MSDNNDNEKWLEERLDEVERRLGHRHPYGLPSVFEQLYISPRTLLLSVTLMNVALFIGGTVYTGVQVDSIQKRYEEASQKIADAKQKYEEADFKLKSIQSIFDQTRVTLTDIQQQADKQITDLQKKSKENGDEIASIRNHAEQELDLLKSRSASIAASMSSYQKDTEAALAKAANDVGLKLEKEIQFNKEAIDKKQASIDTLGLQIEGLSAKVKEKALEISKIQKDIEDQLSTAKKLNEEFTNQIKELAHTDKVTIPVVYRITDVWAKILIGLIFIGSLLAIAFGLTGFVSYLRNR